VAHSIRSRDELALEEDTHLTARHLYGHVLELHRTDSVAVGNDSDGVGEVASVVVVLALDALSDVLAVGKVHALLDRHVGDGAELNILDGARAAKVTIDKVLHLGEHVELSGLHDDEAVTLRNFLLIKGLSSGEDAIGQHFTVSRGISGRDYRATGVVKVLGAGTSREVEQTGNALVHCVGKGLALLMRELLTNVKVEHGVLKIVDHQISQKETVNVDDGLADGRVVGAENHSAFLMVMGASDAGVVERRAVAVSDGVDSVQITENALAVKSLHNIEFVVGDEEGFRFGGVPIGRDNSVVGSKPRHTSGYGLMVVNALLNKIRYKYQAPLF